MIQKRLVLKNAIFSIAQVVLVGGVLVFLYGFLIRSIGIEAIGIWSLVLASTSVASIANLGLLGSVVKFVAKYNALDDQKNVADVIETASITVAVVLTLVLIIVYFFADWILTLIVPSTDLGEAQALLPYALICLWLAGVSAVFNSGVDGFQLIYIRNILVILSSIFYLVLCLVLVPHYKLIGLAYAQIIQAVLVLLSIWLILRHYLPLLPIIPYRWSRKLFNEMIGYGVNFQIATISVMLYDPVTKALLSKFGGLSMVGFYSMANNAIQQLRSLIVSANSVLVPTIADVYEKNKGYVQVIYRDSYRLLLYVSIPLFAGIIAFSPYISQIWIGHHESVFILFLVLSALGCFIHLLAGPTFISNLGTGELRWNTIGQVTIGVLNACLGLLFGSLFGGKAVVVAWVLSLSIGSLLIPFSYHYRYGISINELFPRENIMIISAGLTAMYVSLTLYYELHDIINIFLLTFISSVVFIAILGFPTWKHPMRGRLTSWLISGLLVKQEQAVLK